MLFDIIKEFDILVEYECEVWDTNRLEKIPLNAAWIITGLPVFTSLRSLYYKTGWETLADRGKLRKLTLMYKIVNGEAPSYLIDLLLNRIDNAVAYNLINRNYFEIQFSRLCSIYTSTLKLWNELDPQIQTVRTLLHFKSYNKTLPDKIVDYTSVGERKCNIVLALIRHRCSSLNADLYSANIIPVCRCRAPSENAEH